MGSKNCGKTTDFETDAIIHECCTLGEANYGFEDGKHAVGEALAIMNKYRGCVVNDSDHKSLCESTEITVNVCCVGVNVSANTGFMGMGVTLVS